MMSAPSSRWVVTLRLPKPTLMDNTADADRLVMALKSRLNCTHIRIDPSLMRALPERLRRWDYQTRCVVFKDHSGWVLVDATAADSPRNLLGLAIDLGSSRVVLQIVDLSSGTLVGQTSFDNPQLTIGADILTRIHHCDTPGGLVQLQLLIREGLNRAIADLCQNYNLTAEDLYLAAVAGNTAMTHLFLALTPRYMIREPYIPAVNRPGLWRAADLALDLHPQARVFVFPNIGSYFGGDLVAGILFSGIHRRAKPALMVDVGTNAEVVLGSSDWLIACAGAAGPALEGGVSRMGMMAGSGVIDRVRIEAASGDFDIRTIDGQPPRGICGSGMIDLAAQLFLAGMIDIRGKLVPAACGPRLIRKDGQDSLVVVPAQASASGAALTISQADLDSLIRSKAAMYTILETLCLHVGLAPENLSTFYVAGTFGSLIDPVSAIAIGMLPDLKLDRFHSLGNSSLGGAVQVLVSRADMDEIDHIRDRITYIELNVNQDFMNRFSAAKFLPHTDAERFPSVCVQKSTAI